MKKISIVKNKKIIFILFFILVCIIYNYYNIFQLPPRSIHQWRQSDGLSMTLNYYYDGMNFFSPEIHCLISDNGTSGKAVGECPILYYFIAILWKIFGVHEWIYRFVGLLFVFLGLYSLFRITDYFVKNTFWSIGLSILLFTSPIFANYGISFLTNVPAICLVLAGWWYFLRFYITKKNSILYFSMILFLIAGLLKISSLISYIFLLMLFIGERMPFLNKKKKFIFNDFNKNIIPFLLVIIINFAWYYYAKRYNNIHGQRYFTDELRTIWGMDKNKIFQFLLQIRKNTIYQLFNPLVLYSFIFMFLTIILTPKKQPKFFLFGTYLLIIGGILYIFAWFQAFDVHDYYYIDLLIIIIFIYLTFLIFLKNNFEQFLKSFVLKILFLIFLVFNIIYCHDMLELRYFPKKDKQYIVEGIQDIGLYKWYDWNYENTIKACETITPYLRSIGIHRNDKVLSIPDQSLNISLYLMDQKGFTDHDFNDLKGADRIKKIISLGAKYLIINNKNLLSEDYMSPFLIKKIGEYKNVLIYDLRNLK